jgi:hypothetical protein
MKKGQCITVSFAILLAAATTFSFPIQKKHGFSFRMVPLSAMAAQTPKSAGGVVTHLVLDSAVDEEKGSISIIKAFYNEKGRLDSSLTMGDQFFSSKWRTAFFFNAIGTMDSMLQQSWGDGDWVNETKWFFTLPMSQYYFSSSFDGLSEGHGVTMYSDFSFLLSMTAGYGKEWDSIGREWRYYGKDTLISIENDKKSYHYYEWDTISNSWQISELDTITILNGKTKQAIENYRFDSTWYRYRHSYLYDQHDKVIEYDQEKLDISNQSWEFYSKQKYTLTYNDHNHLTSSRIQEWDSFSDTWTPIDSGSYGFYSYTYDSSGNVIKRIDSTMNYWNDEPSKITHYFQYQTFSSPVVPRRVSKSNLQQPVIVSSDGKIKLQPLIDKNLSAALYTLSGRSICRIPLHSDLCLNDYSAQKGIHLGNGIFLLRIKSDKTGQPIGEWKVFLR